MQEYESIMQAIKLLREALTAVGSKNPAAEFLANSITYLTHEADIAMRGEERPRADNLLDRARAISDAMGKLREPVTEGQ